MGRGRRLAVFLGVYTAIWELPALKGKLSADAFEPAEGDHGGAAGFALRGGILVQAEGCPQAISEEEASVREGDSAWAGGVATLSKSTIDATGRTGNHFVAISRTLSMAFCCKYKVLTLPGKDDVFPTEGGAPMQLPRRRFTFSSNGTGLPTVPGYEDLPDRPEVCPPEHEVDGSYYFFRDAHEDLQRCIERVFLLGCEAEYLREIVGGGDDDGLCGLGQEEPKVKEENQQAKEEEERGLGTSNSPAGVSLAVVDIDKNRKSEENGGGGESLVVHIRSGDIFKPDREGWHGMIWYGQFYLKTISLGALVGGTLPQWTDVSVISNTNGHEDETNPTFGMLEELAGQGLLKTNMTVYRDRPFSEDLRTMLCAENLVLAGSSLGKLFLHHARAKRFFVPADCNATLLGATNLTAFCSYRPEVELYGVEWKTSSEAYSLYNSNWKRSDAQMLEMIRSKEIQGIRRCCVTT